MPRNGKIHAYCGRDGAIHFGQRVPRGALLIASAQALRLRAAVEAQARLAYDNETLLVPGIPEAADDYARARFSERVRSSLATGGVHAA